VTSLWPRVEDVREEFANLRRRHVNGEDTLVVGGTLELVGTSFIADSPTIFGAPDMTYVDRELEWYMSQSRNVRDIPGGPPKIWETVADSDGMINSNYGYLMFNGNNWGQYDAVVAQLESQKGYGRRAVAVYTRPSIHVEWDHNGMSDFICTNAVNYYERDGQLHAVVQMRSNDVVFGYRNDYAWQRYVLHLIAGEVGAEPGDILWQAGSLHVYERHWHLLDEFIKSGVVMTSVGGVLPDRIGPEEDRES
jgi:thymidylate synthase